jgi:hypothetical protein
MKSVNGVMSGGGDIAAPCSSGFVQHTAEEPGASIAMVMRAGKGTHFPVIIR